MAIEEKTTPYELLVRFENGVPAGAHVKYLHSLVRDDGTVIQATELPAEPVDLAAFPLSGLLSDALRDSLAQVTVLNAQITRLNAQIDAMAAQTKID